MEWLVFVFVTAPVVTVGVWTIAAVVYHTTKCIKNLLTDQ
jgi:hypothetical protein